MLRWDLAENRKIAEEQRDLREFEDESSGDCESVGSDDDDIHLPSKSLRPTRPMSLGARMAARRQREANAEKREAEEEVIDTDHPISAGLPAGLHNVLNEISKAFAQNSTIALPTLPSPQPSNSTATPRQGCRVSQSQHHSSELRRQSDAQFLLSSTSDSFPERAQKDVSNAHEHYMMEEANEIEMQEASLDEDRLVHENVAKRGGRRDIQCEDLGKGLKNVQVERIREQDRSDCREKLQEENAEIGDERKVVESRGGGDGECFGKGVGGLRQVLQTSSKSVLKDKRPTPAKGVRKRSTAGREGLRKSLVSAELTSDRSQKRTDDDAVFDFESESKNLVVRGKHLSDPPVSSRGKPAKTCGEGGTDGNNQVSRAARCAVLDSDGGGVGGGGVRAMFAISLSSQQATAKVAKGGRPANVRASKGAGLGWGGRSSQTTQTGLDSRRSQTLSLRQRLAIAEPAMLPLAQQHKVQEALEEIDDFSDDDIASRPATSLNFTVDCEERLFCAGGKGGGAGGGVGGCGSDRNVETGSRDGGGAGNGRSRRGRDCLAEGEDVASPDSGGASGFRGQEGDVGGMGAEASSGPPSLSPSKGRVGDMADSQASTRTPGSSFLRQIGAVAHTGPLWNTHLKPFKRNRGKGELGNLLCRCLLQHQKDQTLFNHLLLQSNSFDAPASTSFDAALRWLVAVVVEEHVEANLSLCICRAASVSGPRYLHVLWPSSIKKIVPRLVVGSVAKLFAPWDLLALPSTSTQVLLASDRTQVIRTLDPETWDLQQVDTLLLQQTDGFLPIEFEKEPEKSHSTTLRNVADISSLPLANLTLSDASANMSVKIKELDAWMTQVSLQGGVVVAFPRGALISGLSWDQAQLVSSLLDLLVRDMQTKDVSLDWPSPIFLIADATGVVAVKVPLTLAEYWLPLLVGADGGTAEYAFDQMSFESATGGVELSKSLHVHMSTDTPPINPAILVVTARSTFRRLESSQPAAVSCGALRSRKLLLDVLQTPGRIIQNKVDAGEDDLMPRVNVLVNVQYKSLSPSLMWTKDTEQQRHLLLCVRDESLEPAGLQNVLLVVADPYQMLACAALLEEGDCILVRGALVLHSSSYSGSAQMPKMTVPHSFLGGILVDSSASLYRVQENGGNCGGFGIGRNCYVEAFGCILPCVSLERQMIPILKEMKESGAVGVRGLPLVSQETCERNAWQEFAGIIVRVDHVQTRFACPNCMCEI